MVCLLELVTMTATSPNIFALISAPAIKIGMQYKNSYKFYEFTSFPVNKRTEWYIEVKY